MAFDRKEPDIVAMDNRKLEAVRMRVQQIRTESPWMEDYEIEAIVCTEFNLDSFNVSEFRAVVDKNRAPMGHGAVYSAIKEDAIGKFGAYESVNKGAAQRKDLATRALYTLTENADNTQNAAVLKKAAATISNNIKSESGRVGFTLLLFVIMEIVISVVIVMFTVSVMGWSIDEVYDFITKPQSMAMLHGGMLLLGLAFPFLAYLYIHKLPINEMVPLHSLRKGELGPLVWMGLAMMMLDGCFVNYIAHPGAVRGANYSMDVISFGTSAMDILLTFFCLGVIPAIIESFVFNGVILQVLRRRGGDAFALIVSSLLFAILTTNFVEMPGAFLSAMWLGYMVIYSGSLIPAVVVRLIDRLLFFAITQLGFILPDIEIVMYIDCLVTVVILVAGLLSMVTLLRRFPEYFVLKRSDPVVNLGKKVGMAMSRWSVLLLIVYSLAFSALQLLDINAIIERVSASIYG